MTFRMNSSHEAKCVLSSVTLIPMFIQREKSSGVIASYAKPPSIV